MNIAYFSIYLGLLYFFLSNVLYCFIVICGGKVRLTATVTLWPDLEINYWFLFLRFKVCSWVYLSSGFTSFYRNAISLQKEFHSENRAVRGLSKPCCTQKKVLFYQFNFNVETTLGMGHVSSLNKISQWSFLNENILSSPWQYISFRQVFWLESWCFLLVILDSLAFLALVPSGSLWVWHAKVTFKHVYWLGHAPLGLSFSNGFCFSHLLLCNISSPNLVAWNNLLFIIIL